MVSVKKMSLGVFLIASMLIASGLANTVSAQEEVVVQSENNAEVRVLPDSLLYGFKLMWEEVVDIFVTGRAQIERNLVLAERRAEEARVMAIRKKEDLSSEAALRAQARYDQALEVYELTQARLNTEAKAEVAAKIQDSIERHLTVLEEVYERVSENGKRGLDRALESSSQVIERLDRSVDRLEEEEVQIRGNLDARIEALREKRRGDETVDNEESTDDEDAEDEDEDGDEDEDDANEEREDSSEETETRTETEVETEVETETDRTEVNVNVNSNINAN